MSSFILLLFSPWVVSNSLYPCRVQLARLLCPLLSPRVCANSCPLSQLMPSNHPSSAALISFCLQFFPGSGSLPVPVSLLFASGGQSIGASAAHHNFQWIFRVDFLKNWLICSPGDSQEASPAPQFENIIFSLLSLFYGPTLTFVHDYWKNHSFDYAELCRQNLVSAF